MFLRELNEEAKDLFLDLSIYAAMANDICVDEEKVTIDDYCFELGINEVRYEASKPLEDVLKQIKGCCNTSEINIVMVEILALLMSDEVVDEKERDFVKKLQNVFEISEEKVEKMMTVVKAAKETIASLYALI